MYITIVKNVCRYLFSSLRNKEANIGDQLKKGSKFEQRGRKYATFCIYNNLFPMRFQFHALLKLQLNFEFTILPFFGP